MHLLSLLLAIAALALLTTFAALFGGASHVVGYSIFGSSLVLFYLVRSVLVYSRKPTRKERLQKWDHTMIYLLTAATYSPVTLLLPERGWGWSIFGVVWGLALLATIFRLFTSMSPKRVTLGLYSLLLILDIVAFSTVHPFLTQSTIFWFTLGGAAYLFETFLVVSRPALPTLFKNPHFVRAHETLAFPFVILGSFSHFWALLTILD